MKDIAKTEHPHGTMLAFGFAFLFYFSGMWCTSDSSSEDNLDILKAWYFSTCLSPCGTQ